MAKSKPESIITAVLKKRKLLVDESFDNFKISFQYLDTTQKYGCAFKDWQSVGLLSKMLETIQGFCHSPLKSQLDGSKFALYGGFPKSEDTLFIFPSSVPEDSKWARIHVTGPAVVVGHIVGDTFYVVFLDKTHKFWLTSKAKGK